MLDVGWAGLPAHAFKARSHATERDWLERVGGAAAHPTSADQAAVFFWWTGSAAGAAVTGVAGIRSDCRTGGVVIAGGAA